MTSKNEIVLHQDFAEIVLLNGDKAKIDLKDINKISSFRWRFNNGYARGVIGNRLNHVYLHHFLMGQKDGLEIDHKNGNGLDNRRCNLRFATSMQNKMNKKALGIFPRQRKNGIKWEAYISMNKKRLRLGLFDKREDALKVRKEAVRKYFGDFSYDKR